MNKHNNTIPDTACAKPGWMLAGLTIMMVTLNLDLTVANLALAPIAKSLQIDMVTIQWVINGCLIASAVFMPIAGRLGDIHGHRRIFTIGALIFLIASIAAGAAQGSVSIIIARIVQGFGISLCFPMIYAIAFREFNESQRGMATGIITTGTGFAQAIGPTLGGLLIHFLSWRWVFFINIPLVLLACLILTFTAPSVSEILASTTISKRSVTLLGIGLFMLMLTLNKAQQWGITSLTFGISLIVSLALLLSFGLLEKTRDNPILDLKLLTNKSFVLIMLMRILYCIVFFSLLFTLGMMLQNIFGYTASKAGLIMLFMTVIFGAIAPICGRWIDKIGIHPPLLTGMSCLTIACGLLAGFGIPFTVATFYLSLFLIGVASGILLPSTAVAALSQVSKDKTGMATGLFYTNLFIASAFGVAMAGYILSTASAHHLRPLIATASFSTQQLSGLLAAACGLQPLAGLQAYMGTTWQSAATFAHQSFMAAFQLLMQINFICAASGLLIAWYLYSKKRQQ